MGAVQATSLASTPMEGASVTEKGTASQVDGKLNPVLKQWICGEISLPNKEVRKYSCSGEKA